MRQFRAYGVLGLRCQELAMKKIKTLWLASKRAQLKRAQAELRKQKPDQKPRLKLVVSGSQTDKDN